MGGILGFFNNKKKKTVSNTTINLFGLIVGILLSSFWHESIFINEIIHQQDHSGGGDHESTTSIDSNNPQAEATTTTSSSRHYFEERLDTCSKKLNNLLLERQRKAEQLESRTTATICTFWKKSPTPSHNSLYHIDEFVDYHLSLGFNSIYIYYYDFHGDDDDDEDNVDVIIQNWADTRNPNQIIVNRLLLLEEPLLKTNDGNNTTTHHYQEIVYKKCLQDQEQISNNNNNDENSNSNSNNQDNVMVKHNGDDGSTTPTSTSTKSLSYKNDWITYLDINEFIVLKKESKSNYTNNIVDMLQDIVTTTTATATATIPPPQKDDNQDLIVVELNRFSFVVDDGLNNVNHTKHKQAEILLSDSSLPVLKRFQYYRPLNTKQQQSDAGVVKTNIHKVISNNHKKESQDDDDYEGTKVFSLDTDIAVIHHYPYHEKTKNNVNEEEEEEDVSMLSFDDTAWTFLYTSVPLYDKYNT